LKAQIAGYHHESLHQDASRDSELRNHLDQLCRVTIELKAQMRGFQDTLQQSSKQIHEREVGNMDEEQTKLLDDMQDMETTSRKVQRRATMRIQALTSLAEETSVGLSVPAQPPLPLPSRSRAVPHKSTVAVVEAGSDNNFTPKPRGDANPVTTPKKHYSDAPQVVASRRISPSQMKNSDEDTVSPPSLSVQDFEVTFTSIVSTAKEKHMGISKPFSDEVILQVSKSLVSAGKQAWGERPRTYLVLRLIDEVSAMDKFIFEGLKDIHFPYDEATLPSCIQSRGARQSFLKNQKYVLSERSVDLVNGGRHHHLGTLLVSGLQKLR
jgi:hypothetical protein